MNGSSLLFQAVSDQIADEAAVRSDYACRVTVTPQRRHLSFSTLPETPKPKVVSMT